LVDSLSPGFIPEVYKFSKFKTPDPPTYFNLFQFIDMDVTAAPDPIALTSKLAELHKKSQSPTGKFGFHITTCDGRMAHTVEWEESWAVFFAKLIRGVCKLDLETNGPWPELERATDQICTKVIPRLLGTLTSEGRPIKPSLIHGDLWDGNLGISMETGEVIMYDAGSYYAHNEMELSHWRVEFASHLRSKVYLKQYLRNYPPAEPGDEFDDRNRLYSLKASFNYSAGHPGSFLRKT
jgi:protein-ribulosamine 3-kinase